MTQAVCVIGFDLDWVLYMYICICIFIHTHIYIYVYIFKESLLFIQRVYYVNFRIYFTVLHVKISVIVRCLCLSLTFWAPLPSTSFFCWVLSCIWSLLSSPVSLECFCWSLTFPEVPQGCMYVYVCKARCLLFGLCLSMVSGLGGGGWGGWESVYLCVRVGAAGALWPGASGRNSLHSQGSAWDKSSPALLCTWLRTGDGDFQAWPKPWHAHTHAQRGTSTGIISAPINLKCKTTPSSTKVKLKNLERGPPFLPFPDRKSVSSSFSFCFSTS